MSSSLKEQTKEMLMKAQKSISNAQNSMAGLSITAIIVIALIVIIIMSIFLWIYTKLTLDNANCKRMNKLYKSFPGQQTGLQELTV